MFKITDDVEGFSVSITSTPVNSDFGYFEGQSIRVQVDFAEAVTVTGLPYLVLDVGGQARRATYESGAGTRYLVFAYGVARGDTDANGVSLCSDTMKDASCGRIALDGGSIVAQSDSVAAGLDLPELGQPGDAQGSRSCAAGEWRDDHLDPGECRLRLSHGRNHPGPGSISLRP